MKRQRTIAAAPVRSAYVAWRVVVDLLSRTLELNPDVPAGSVARELEILKGLGPALVAGGHFDSNGLVLADVGMHLTIFVKTADAALTVDENLNPVPGGADSTGGWVLYVPRVGALDPGIEGLAKRSRHLSVEQPPRSTPSANTASGGKEPLLDLKAFRKAVAGQ